MVYWVLGLTVSSLLAYLSFEIYMERKRKRDIYPTSLYHQLRLLNIIIPMSYTVLDDPVFQNFKTVRLKIYGLLKQPKTKRAVMETLDTMAVHEIAILNEIRQTVKQGVPITDPHIKHAIQTVTHELHKLYDEFCDAQTARLQMEVRTLETLKQQEQNRKDWL